MDLFKTRGDSSRRKLGVSLLGTPRLRIPKLLPVQDRLQGRIKLDCFPGNFKGLFGIAPLHFKQGKGTQDFGTARALGMAIILFALCTSLTEPALPP